MRGAFRVTLARSYQDRLYRNHVSNEMTKVRLTHRQAFPVAILQSPGGYNRSYVVSAPSYARGPA